MDSYIFFGEQLRIVEPITPKHPNQTEKLDIAPVPNKLMMKAAF